jgi:hypothetical protein
MGTRLPIFPYIAAEVEIRGGTAIGPRRTAMKQFLTYISRKDVQAFRQSLVVPEEFDPGKDVWVRELSYEEDCYARAELANLIDRVGCDGCIIVPTLGDIFGHKSVKAVELIDRAERKGVQIMVIASAGIDYPLSGFGESADAKVFDFMWRNAMSVSSRLNKMLQNAEQMKNAARRFE